MRIIGVSLYAPTVRMVMVEAFLAGEGVEAAVHPIVALKAEIHHYEEDYEGDDESYETVVRPLICFDDAVLDDSEYLQSYGSRSCINIVVCGWDSEQDESRLAPHLEHCRERLRRRLDLAGQTDRQ